MKLKPTTPIKHFQIPIPKKIPEKSINHFLIKIRAEIVHKKARILTFSASYMTQYVFHF